MRKNILCFGDSNTYGDSPERNGRYPYEERWTGILQESLGNQYRILEEGLNGRTSVWEDPVEGDKCGIRHLPAILASHTPLDLLIIMLGTNDIKRRFSASAADIGMGMERLIGVARSIPNYTSKEPFQILLVSPPEIREWTLWGDIFQNQNETSKKLAAEYKAVAERCGVWFMDIAQYAQPSKLDGLHFDRENHKKVAAAMEAKIREILG